jgi:hypothetical protein
MSRKKNADDSVLCRTPTSGKTTRIEGWKFFVVRQGILDAMSVADGGVFLKDLPAKLTVLLGEKSAAIGDLESCISTVKMELEVRGEIIRSTKNGRQWLKLGTP